MAVKKTMEERLKDLERSQPNSDFVPILEGISRDVAQANKKLDEQNGRISKHSDRITELKIEVKELSTEIKNLPCAERLTSCKEARAIIANGIRAKNTAVLSKSATFYGLIGALLTSGVALIIWTLSTYLE